MTEQHKTVRLLTVKTPWDSGLLGVLLEDFTDRSGYDVRVQTGDETLYDLARAGEADVVISHYGHKGVRSFMDEGFGDWPTTVFANQPALVGPPVRSGERARRARPRRGVSAHRRDRGAVCRQQ